MFAGILRHAPGLGTAMALSVTACFIACRRSALSSTASSGGWLFSTCSPRPISIPLYERQYPSALSH
jgi:hypothetical protein